MQEREKSLLEFLEEVPDEQAAREWFEKNRWPEGRTCPHCRGTQTVPVKNEKPQPYRCKDCGSFFSVKTGSIMHRSKIPLRKWALAIFLLTHSKKGVSSCKLARDLGTTQKTAWAMAHRIRDSWKKNQPKMEGPIEVDETYLGGKEANKHFDKRMRVGSGQAGKACVIAAVDRTTRQVHAEAIKIIGRGWGHGLDALTLRGFVHRNVKEGSKVFSDDNRSYRLMKGYDHSFVTHSKKQYVKDDAHVNSCESLFALVKRTYTGTYHSWSYKHLPRYVKEIAWRLNHRDMSTEEKMGETVRGMSGKKLSWRKLISCFLPPMFVRQPCAHQYIAMVCYFCLCCGSHVC